MTRAPATPALRTLTSDRDAPPLADALLIATVLQGTSVTLSFAVRLDASGRAAALVTLGWLACYAVAALLLVTRAAPDWLGWSLRYRLPLVMLVAGVCLSAFWSVAPPLTIERSVHFAGSTLVAIALGMTIPLPRMLSIARRTFALIIVASVLVSLFVPAVGIEDYQGRLVWRGVTASKNTLGFWSAIAAMLFLLPALERRSVLSRLTLLTFGALSLLCLVQSVSATSLLSLLLALLVLAWVSSTRSLSLGPIAAGALAAIALALAAIAIGSIDTAELIGRSGDLTGRAELWAQTWELIRARPLTGYGYGTLWYPTESSLWIQRSLLDLSWITHHAHNGLLQLASAIGLPLTLLAIVFALQQLIEVVYAHYRNRPEGSLFVLGFLVALLVSNYAEARLLVNRELYWIWMVALPLSLVRQVVVPASAGGVLAGGPVALPAWQRSIGRAIRPLTPAVRDGLVRRRRDRHVRNALKERVRVRATPLLGAPPDGAAEPSGPPAAARTTRSPSTEAKRQRRDRKSRLRPPDLPRNAS